MDDPVLINDTVFINDEPSLHDACFRIRALIREQRASDQQNKETGELCGDTRKLATAAAYHARHMLSTVGNIYPTFVFMSKAGQGVICPLIMLNLPANGAARTQLCDVLRSLVNTAPIDGYQFIAQAWVTSHLDVKSDDFQASERKPAVMLCCHNATDSTFQILERVHDSAGKFQSFVKCEMPTEFAIGNPLMRSFYDGFATDDEPRSVH
jgi:hypothetical protein